MYLELKEQDFIKFIMDSRLGSIRALSLNNLLSYSAFCYAKNLSIRSFYPSIYVRLEICAWDNFYFTLIFSTKFYGVEILQPTKLDFIQCYYAECHK